MTVDVHKKKLMMMIMIISKSFLWKSFVNIFFLLVSKNDFHTSLIIIDSSLSFDMFLSISSFFVSILKILFFSYIFLFYIYYVLVHFFVFKSFEIS